GLPPDTLADDPELRVRWTVRRTDTNEILRFQDTTALNGIAFSFDATVVPFLQVAQLSLFLDPLDETIALPSFLIIAERILKRRLERCIECCADYCIGPRAVPVVSIKRGNPIL